MTRIYLVGFMGSGKSSVGKILAAKLKMDFIDLDDRIESIAKCSITHIFQHQGEEAFRLLERQALISTQNQDNTIIATGGGTACFLNNMTWIKENGLSIYLKIKPEALCKRLIKQQGHRPLLKNLSEEELTAYIVEQLEKRAPFYTQADVCYEDLDETPVEVAEQLKRHFEQITGH